RHSRRWLGARRAVFAVASVLGGTDLVAGVSSTWRGVVVFCLLISFLLFSALGTGIVIARGNSLWITGSGVVILGLGLAISWSALPTPAVRPSGFVQLNDGHNVICGKITAMDHDFVAITETVREQPSSGPYSTDSKGRPPAKGIPRLVPTASVVSIVSVEDC